MTIVRAVDRALVTQELHCSLHVLQPHSCARACRFQQKRSAYSSETFVARNELGAMAQILAQSATLLSRYEQAAQHHPISTKVATCFVGFALGDVVAQSITRPVHVNITTDGIIDGTESLRQKVSVDVWRAMRMALFGALIAAPQMHIFHGWMEKVCFFLSRALFNCSKFAGICVRHLHTVANCSVYFCNSQI